MIISLAYTNNSLYAYDIAGGLAQGAVTKLDLEVATTTAKASQSGTPFQKILLDGSAWELPVQKFKIQTVQTLPNLLLAGTILSGITLTTFKDILIAWHYANARWVKTDEIVGDITKPDLGFVKVVRNQEKLEFEQVNNISWAQRTVLDFRTAGVYAP